MTKDADFKRLIRARMEKTGESYTTARDALLGAHAASATEFGPSAEALATPVPPPKSQDVVRQLTVRLEDDELFIRQGAKGLFEIRVPVRSIRNARRAPDSDSAAVMGNYGKGKRRISPVPTRLVTFEIDPPVRPIVRLDDIVDGAVAATGTTSRFVRLLARLPARRPLINELTISVNDPEAFLAALGR